MRKYLMKHFEKIYKTETANEWYKILTDADIVNDRLAHCKNMETSKQVWANEYIYGVTCPNSKESILVRLATRSEKMGIPR